MQASDLTRKVTFFSPVLSPDGYGGSESGWSEAFTLNAHIRYLRGGEKVMADRLENRRPVIICVRKSRFSDQVTHDWKAVFDGVDFQINEDPKPIQNRAFVEFLATGGVAVGD